MRISPRFFTPTADWIIFLATVGVSLTLLFLGKSHAIGVVKGEIGDLLSVAVSPTRVVTQGLDMWKENRDLRDLAMRLSTENSSLRDAAFENERLRAMLDFKQRFELPLKGAQIIAYPGTAIGGELTMDAGDDDGVKLNSVVLTPEGLVGKVVEVADHTSIVQSLEGNTYGVSVLVERSRLMGILRWQSPGVWKIVGLPTGADIKIGDLILTTGEGSVFPKGIRVGVVSLIRTGNNSMGKDYLVRPFVNFQTVEEVFFVASSDRKP